MSGPVQAALHSVPPTRAQALARALAQTLRGWRWRDTGLGLALGVLCLLYMGGPLMPGGLQRSWAVPLAYNVLQFGWPMVLAVRLADRAVDAGGSAWRAYGAAVLGVVGIGVWVIGPALMPVLGYDPQWTIVNDVWLAVGIGVLYALGMAVYAHWRATQRALARMQQRDAARARAQQQLQSARLLGLQARVEPQLLFDALGRVEWLIGDGRPQAAESLLDDLIALLRLLLPSAGAQASTLARELALVDAFARVAQQPSPLQAAPDTLPPDVAAAPLAPMLLNDLLRALAPLAPAWRLSADATAAGLRLLLAPAGAARPAPPPDLAALQQRLAEVHGAGARLGWADGPPPAVTLDLPTREER